MKKRIIAFAGVILLATACEKSKNNGTADFETLKTEVLADFTNKVAVASYSDLHVASEELYTAISNLNTTTTDANLTIAKDKWKNMRSIWEKCEGFLFGPVDENSYDPNMDTWPTDHAQMDSLLTSTNPLELMDIQNATLSLRGYHPIEYIIFGDHGDRLAANITARQKKYMLSLAEDLKNTCHDLHESWTAAPTNYQAEVIGAGTSSTVFAKKQEAYMAIVEGLIGICEEVGEGKMKEPFDAMDATIVESPYSGNSWVDFKNNIIGLQNVYLGKYKQDGKGLNELVALKNKALDNKIQTQLAAAISSFDNVTLPFEDAIMTQRPLVQQTMDALDELKTTLDGELKPFVIQYITD